MHLLSRYYGAIRTLDGDLTISFVIDDDINIDELTALKDKKLTLEIEKYSPKKSAQANRYFWKLCTLIAEKLGSDKDSIYQYELRRAGVFVDLSILAEALPSLQKKYRFIEVIDDFVRDGKLYHEIRCYFGLSTYTQDEISKLLNNTVQEAKELGISTWSKEEIDNLINNWKG